MLQGLLQRSWGALRSFWGAFGPHWDAFGTLLGHLERGVSGTPLRRLLDVYGTFLGRFWGCYFRSPCVIYGQQRNSCGHTARIAYFSTLEANCNQRNGGWVGGGKHPLIRLSHSLRPSARRILYRYYNTNWLEIGALASARLDAWWPRRMTGSGARHKRSRTFLFFPFIESFDFRRKSLCMQCRIVGGFLWGAFLGLLRLCGAV